MLLVFEVGGSKSMRGTQARARKDKESVSRTKSAESAPRARKNGQAQHKSQRSNATAGPGKICKHSGKQHPRHHVPQGHGGHGTLGRTGAAVLREDRNPARQEPVLWTECSATLA